jgi:hypothetical protein
MDGMKFNLVEAFAQLSSPEVAMVMCYTLRPATGANNPKPAQIARPSAPHFKYGSECQAGWDDGEASSSRL